MSPGPDGLYVGAVVHLRLRPKRHKLRYGAFWLLVDIDRLDECAGRLRTLSRNRFNLFALFDRDYGDDPALSLRQQVDAVLSRGERGEADGRTLLLTMPRVLGYAFNPLSVFFCYRPDGRLSTIVYEVHNTFGERHRYVLAADSGQGPELTQSCDKTFHVSPFLGMAMTYVFSLRPPDERIAIAIEGRDGEGAVIRAALSGTRRDLSDAALLRLFFGMPLLTFKVIAAIHWEALRMWIKGFRVFPHPGRRNGEACSETVVEEHI